MFSILTFCYNTRDLYFFRFSVLSSAKRSFVPLKLLSTWLLMLVKLNMVLLNLSEILYHLLKIFFQEG